MAYTSIDNPELYFQVKTWTGTGSSNALTLDGDEDMQPDYVMIKQRSSTQQWNGYDSIRGVQKYIGWNTNIAENTQSQGLTAFGSDGFTVGTDDMVNKSSSTYVAFCWKANGSGSSNTEGNTDTTISANTTAGFSIIDGCDDLNDDDTFGHGLNSTPDMVFLKRLDDVAGWRVFYTGITDGSTLILDTTAAVGDDGATVGPVSSTLITVEGSGTGGNEGDNENVAYAWHSVQGYSKIGIYTGNGNADGPFIYTGFRPAFVMTKATNASDDWSIADNKRNPYNLAGKSLRPNSNSDEDSSQATNYSIDILSNGFKPRTSGTTSANANNATSNDYLYMAFAEAPFVNSNGVPNNAR